MNNFLDKAGRDHIKELLSQCDEKQQLMFKRMYAHKTLELPINDCVDLMLPDCIYMAIVQCELTVKKNKLKQQSNETD
jgi:hypothetical protein